MESELSWDSKKIETLKQSLNGEVDIGEGYASIFVPLSENIGVKLFPQEGWRDYALEKQSVAAKHGVGPAVGEAFEVAQELRDHPMLVWQGHMEATGQHVYGYVTQRADMTCRPSGKDIAAFTELLVSIRELTPPPIHDFEDNPANYGYIDGRIVFVDFDTGTWSTPGMLPVDGSVARDALSVDASDAAASERPSIRIRRLAQRIEESLFRGTKWVVFEPNDEPLWARIRQNVGAFMMRLFRQGAFQGDTPSKAFFVKCDSETTTAEDRNKGVVKFEVGFAPLKPAEFVIIRITQVSEQQ
ncbi:MAG: phage tail sheath family protein [Planctomycetes bacterium]|nr:phage tail sheath family protein [Planctomycetota bacterium]